MSNEDTCFICGNSLSADLFDEVKEKGLKKIKECSAKRNDGNSDFLANRVSVKVHQKCRKKYTNEKSVLAAAKQTSRQVSIPNVLPIRTSDFPFEKQCFFCEGDVTETFLKNEKKKPADKRIVVSQVSSAHTTKSIMDAAKDDEWSVKVTARIDGVDLVAVGAQYHRPCYKKFCLASRNSTCPIGRPISEGILSSMEIIFQYIEDNKEQCQFTLQELSNLIEDPPSNATLKTKLIEKYGENIYIHSRTGHPTIVSIRNHQALLDSWYSSKIPDLAAERMRIVKAAAAIIREDIQTKIYDTDYYPSPDRFLEAVEDDVPETLQEFLKTVILTNKKSSCDVYEKQCTAIAHWIIAAERPRTFRSSLQVGLSAYIHSRYGSKNLVDVLSALGCCASYYETETFQLSSILHPDEDAATGFLQFVADNADVNVGTLDGHGTFHSMGMIQCVTPKPNSAASKKIFRVTGVYGKRVIQNAGQVTVQNFERGNNAPGLRAITAEMLCNKDPITPRIADVLWMYGKLKDIPRICGWNGFMEKLTSQRKYAVSDITAMPFINAPPSDYNTIYTTLICAAKRTIDAKQQSCFVTFDQPLYQKARDIISSTSDPLLQNVIVRLGGFHLLMSFLGCIGYIMAGSGLKEVLSLIYAPVSVDKMLTGHAYARAIRGHLLTQLTLGRMILAKLEFTVKEQIEIEDLLEHFDSETGEQRMADEMFSLISQRVAQELQKLEGNGPTAALWIQYFRMVILVKQFIEAERTGNWKLHLSTIAQMLPFFHAAGHFNYALSAHLYLQDMTDLESKMGYREYHNFVTNGYFSIRRTDKFWSGIWSDMTIEQTLMRSMKSTGGLTRGRGLTNSVLTKWILGMPIMQKVSEAIEDFAGVESSTSEQHVDARPSRQVRDNADVEKLLQWFQDHDPFPSLDKLVSLSTGVVGGNEIDCFKAQSIGFNGVEAIIGKSFADISFSRKKRVLPLSAMTSSLKIADTVVPVDPTLLFQRISFTKESQEQLKSFFAFELAPFPLSLFDEVGMRKSKKAAMYDLFTPITTDVTSGDVAYVIDGGHLLHKVVWRKGDTFDVICKKYVDYIKKQYGEHATIVFDGYPEEAAAKSTKTAERLRRLKSVSVEVIIDEFMPSTTSQDKFLSNERNKSRLITLLMSKLRRAGYNVKQHVEDADTLTVYTALEIAGDYETVIIVGEDVDLLIMLTGVAQEIHTNVYFMKCGKKSLKSIYSTNSLKNKDLAPYILMCHAFTGCDTTSALFNQGKTKLASLVMKDDNVRAAMDCFKVQNADPDVIADAGERILIRMYGGKLPKTIDELRYEGFARSITKSKFNLAGLPPTKAAADQHCYRVYHQIQQWMGRDLPATLWGWERGPSGLIPKLTTLEAAPSELLKLVSCRCEKGCGRMCSCRKSGLKCSEICYSCHGRTCTNVKPFEVDDLNEDDDRNTVENTIFNVGHNEFGEPQDEFFDSEDENADVHASPEPAGTTGDIPEENLPSSDNLGSPGPSTRKRRRVNDDKTSDESVPDGR